MRKVIIFFFAFILSCSDNPIIVWENYDESQEIEENSNHKISRMRYKRLQSLTKDRNEIFKPFYDFLKSYDIVYHDSIKDLIINQDISLEKCPALVLNADYRPLSYYPLSLWSWQDSIKSVFLDRVITVSNYDRVVRSPSFSLKLPSVLALKSYVKPQSNPNFTRFNVFLRDKFTCQYCGSKNELTFDHLLPRSKGGKTDWNNVVTACTCCNVKKGWRLPIQSGMTVNQKPFQPSTEDLHKNGKNFPPNFLHKSWIDYLYWDVELEP